MVEAGGERDAVGGASPGTPVAAAACGRSLRRLLEGCGGVRGTEGVRETNANRVKRPGLACSALFSSIHLGQGRICNFTLGLHEIIMYSLRLEI
jgi:hypothetical protein